jgi:hypothetical protein
MTTRTLSDITAEVVQLERQLVVLHAEQAAAIIRDSRERRGLALKEAKASAPAVGSRYTRVDEEGPEVCLCRADMELLVPEAGREDLCQRA